MVTISKTPLILRILSGISAQTIYIFAIKMVPISFAEIIFNTSSFFVAVLAFAFNKEGLSVLDMVGLIGSFLGVSILVYDDGTT